MNNRLTIDYAPSDNEYNTIMQLGAMEFTRIVPLIQSNFEEKNMYIAIEYPIYRLTEYSRSTLDAILTLMGKCRRDRVYGVNKTPKIMMHAPTDGRILFILDKLSLPYRVLGPEYDYSLVITTY